MKIGVIGGSGLYGIGGLENVREVAVETPYGSPSDAYVTATLGGAEVVFLARHGRGHVVMPSQLNHRANVFGMKQLGVEAIFSVSAVGSLREDYRPGDVVVVDQFVDRTRNAEAATFFGDGIVAHVALADPTCGHLGDLAISCAAAMAAEGAPADQVRMHRGGAYLNMAGPAFSTRAESNLYRSWGMDVIGMTNFPEAKLCREAEICYQSLAMVTDYDCWHESEESVSVEMILATLQKNAAYAQRLLGRLVPAAAVAGRCASTCQAMDALRYAIVTDPSRVSSEMRARLAPILDRYLPA